MAGRPPPGAAFEISRVGRPRSRPAIAVLIWAAALVAIVGAGVLGHEPPQPASRGADPSTGPADVANGPIDLEAPALGPMTLTRPTLYVYGRTRVHVSRLEISLEAGIDRVVDRVVLDVSNPTDGVREDRQPLFRAQFAIPEPRPNGTMWVVVTAYDASGVPLGGERRPFRVGPIVDVETGPYVVVDAPPLDQKRCGPAVSGWRCG